MAAVRTDVAIITVIDTGAHTIIKSMIHQQGILESTKRFKNIIQRKKGKHCECFDKIYTTSV